MRLTRTVGSLAIIAAFMAACTAPDSPDLPASTSAPAPQGQIEQPAVACGNIAVYTSTELGSDEWSEELKQAKAIGFNSVIAYGSMNGSTIDSMKAGLDEALQIGIGVVFSVKDVLGATDTDEVNAERHRGLFGATTDAQVTTVVEELLDHPAITSVLIADERPGGPEDLKKWLPALKKRYDQISAVKPVSAVLYWTPGAPDFYKEVAKYADNLQIDYYPLPENSTYGPVSTIADIGETLWRTAGLNGTFVVQAFGWDPVNHPEGKELGFTKKSPPPTTAQMVEMAKLAVEGNGNRGAMNLAFYLLGEPGSASTDSMRDAVRQICTAEWWKKRRH